MLHLVKGFAVPYLKVVLELMDARCMIIPSLLKNEHYICFYPDFQLHPRSF